MNGWAWSTIGDCCELTSGGTPSKHNPKFWKGDLPFVSARDLKSDRIETAALHIARDAVEESSAKIAPIGSLLILVRGMGLANGIQIGEVTLPVAFNQDIRAIHPPKTIIPRFLLLALRNSFLNGDGENVLSSAAHGTLKIDTDALRSIVIPVPPLPEQRRIVGLLDEAFAAIATAKANTETNLRNARNLLKSQVAAVFTEVDQSRLVALGEVCEFENGDRGKNYPSKSEYVLAGVAWINTGHIRPDGTLSMDEMNYISEAKFNSLRSGKIQPGDLVYCLRGATLGKTALVEPFTIGAVASSLVIIRPSAAVDRHYLFHFLTSSVGQGLIRGYQNGAAQPNLGAKSVAKFKMPLPTRDEQKAVARRIVSVAAETQRLVALYQQKLAALDALKKSLLHQAFSGELGDANSRRKLLAT